MHPVIQVNAEPAETNVVLNVMTTHEGKDPDLQKLGLTADEAAVLAAQLSAAAEQVRRRQSAGSSE